jgi:hypothetical protein
VVEAFFLALMTLAVRCGACHSLLICFWKECGFSETDVESFLVGMMEMVKSFYMVLLCL